MLAVEEVGVSVGVVIMDGGNGSGVVMLMVYKVVDHNPYLHVGHTVTLGRSCGTL